MNLKFVEAFVWVVRLKSITRAAEILCLTQSAVSNRIAALEDELGAQLIDRRTSQFRLSDAGTRFMDYAEKLLGIQREMRNEFGKQGPKAFSLRIEAIESILHTWLIPMVDTLKQSSPMINFELTIETTPTLVDQIRRGSLDLVFSALPAQEDGIVNEVLEPFEMVFVGSKKSPCQGEIPLDDLLQYDIMTFQRGSHPHIGVVNALHSAGIDDKHVHAISSISALALLASNGFGIATLPKSVAERFTESVPVSILKTALPLPPLPIHASYWSTPMNAMLKQTIQAAMAFAHEAGRTMRPQETAGGAKPRKRSTRR